MSNAQYYRSKAQEMRQNAKVFHDAWTNREFLKLAEGFERLADFTEQRWPVQIADADDDAPGH